MSNPSVTHCVVTYLLRENSGQQPEILLGKRPRHKAFGGVWNGPGGKMEKGESPVTAAIRETREEIGVVITEGVMDHFATMDCFYRVDPENTKDYVLRSRVHFFFARTWTGDPRPQEDESGRVFDTVRWHYAHELPWAGMMADQRHWLPTVFATDCHRKICGYGLRISMRFSDTNPLESRHVEGPIRIDHVTTSEMGGSRC